MFVMVLSMGIAHLLTGLSLVFTHHSRLQVHWIPTSWMILLLLVHFELFWHTLAILAVEEWRFAGFLYILTGPVLLYLAMSLMVPDAALVEPGDSLEQYFQMARQFFFLLAMLMVWMIGVDFVLGTGLTRAGIWTAAEAALFGVLAASRSRRLHAPATGVAWVLVLSMLISRGLGVIA